MLAENQRANPWHQFGLIGTSISVDLLLIERVISRTTPPPSAHIHISAAGASFDTLIFSTNRTGLGGLSRTLGGSRENCPCDCATAAGFSQDPQHG